MSITEGRKRVLNLFVQAGREKLGEAGRRLGMGQVPEDVVASLRAKASRVVDSMPDDTIEKLSHATDETLLTVLGEIAWKAVAKDMPS